MAVVRVNDMATQLKSTASTLNSLPIDGKAMLMDAAMKGQEKLEIVVTIRATVLLVITRGDSPGADPLTMLSNQTTFRIIAY